MHAKFVFVSDVGIELVLLLVVFIVGRFRDRSLSPWVCVFAIVGSGERFGTFSGPELASRPTKCKNVQMLFQFWLQMGPRFGPLAPQSGAMELKVAPVC